MAQVCSFNLSTHSWSYFCTGLVCSTNLQSARSQQTRQGEQAFMVLGRILSRFELSTIVLNKRSMVASLPVAVLERLKSGLQHFNMPKKR